MIGLIIIGVVGQWFRTAIVQGSNPQMSQWSLLNLLNTVHEVSPCELTINVKNGQYEYILWYKDLITSNCTYVSRPG